MSPSPQKLSWSRLRRAHQLLLLVLIILIWAAVGLSAAQMLVYEMPARSVATSSFSARSLRPNATTTAVDDRTVVALRDALRAVAPEAIAALPPAQRAELADELRDAWRRAAPDEAPAAPC